MSKKNTLRKLLNYVGKNKLAVLTVILISVPAVLCTLLIPVYSGNALDVIGDILTPGSSISETDIVPFLVRILICAGIYALLKWIIDCVSGRIAHRTVKNIRDDAIGKIMKLPVSALDRRPRGEIINKIITDSDKIAEGLVLGFKELFTGILTIIGTFIFMLRINVWVALAVVMLTPLSLFAAKFISDKTYRLFKKDTETRGRHASFTEENISCRSTVKACGVEDKVLGDFKVLNEELRACSKKALFFSSLVNPITRFTNGIIYAIVAFAGAYICLKGDVQSVFTVGNLTCFLTYASQYAKPFNEISEVIAELQDSLACAAGVFSFLEEREETDVDSTDLTGFFDAPGKVVFDNVCFSYRKDKPLIRNFSLTVLPGTKVAIVGKTGAGKTTLINLMMRFYDCDSGKILVDGKNISEMPRKALRSRFGMVLQDTWLTSGTIYENLSFGLPGVSPEAVIEAAKSTHAHDFIKKLSNGYDTIIGEDSGIISEGQRQLLCITRVLIANPSILILDEATSRIDTMTEQYIQEATYSLTKGRTSFTVAHRLSTIVNADLILFIENGRVAEMGSHRELLAAGGHYAELYNSQFEVNQNG